MPRSRESRKEARSVKGPLSRNHSDAKTLAASSGDGGGGGQRPRRVVSTCVRDVFRRQAPARGRPESPLRYDGAAQPPLPRAARGAGMGAGTRASPACARAKPSASLRGRQRVLAEPGRLQPSGVQAALGEKLLDSS